MALSQKEVEYIAHLARLKIDEKDLPLYTQNISDILNLVAEMNKVDTKSITPMAHPLEVTQRFREDDVTEQNQREKFQAIAPLTEAGLYLVPKVIEEA